MLVSEKGQVTIPKHIRLAAGVAAGSEVALSLEGGRIVITPAGTCGKEDRRANQQSAGLTIVTQSVNIAARDYPKLQVQRHSSPLRG